MAKRAKPKSPKGNHGPKITLAVVKAVLSVVDKGLVFGVGDPKPGKMCVEAAVAYAFGEDHNDHPECVDEPLSYLKIRLNDWRDGNREKGGWSSPKARAKGLRRVAIAQLGSKGRMEGFEKNLKSVLFTYANDHAPRPTDSKGVDKLVAYWRGNATEIFNTGFGFRGVIQSLTDGAEHWNDVRPYLTAVRLANPKLKDMDAILTEAAEIIVQALIKQKIPGTKFLYLTEPKKVGKRKAAKKSKAKRHY